MKPSHVITIDADNCGSFLGPIASQYSYKHELRSILDELFEAAKRSTNRFFVLDGEIVRAAQSTRQGALEYLQNGYVLVEFVGLGCGRRTHVAGTNGGTMPCGAKLNGEPYFCAKCDLSSCTCPNTQCPVHMAVEGDF